MNDARLILTCGLPGAGKTTLATRLATERGAVRLTKDEWLFALGSSPWDGPTGAKVEQELWRLAQEILRLGLSVVLDCALGVAVELHHLDVPAEELWRRIAARNAHPPWAAEPIRRQDLDGWLLAFEAPDAAELALFDPSPAPS